MKLNIKIKNAILEIICLLYVILFVYAALSKLLNFENFRVQLGQSPLLSAFAGSIAWIVPTLELLIAVLIVFKKCRLSGFFSAFSLMVMFTTYIYIILNYSSFVPCSCGGILEKMGWKEHLFFNFVFIMLAAAGILILAGGMPKVSRISKPAVLVSSFLGSVFFSIGIVVVMFVLSEDIMHHRNSFIRRFPHHQAVKISEVDLRYNSYYFAGAANGNLYLGNTTAPLHIVTLDSILKNKKVFQIELDKSNFGFKAVSISILPPYFFVADGNVPCLFRGELSNWKASLFMHDKAYFSRITPMDSSRLAFRGQAVNNNENIIGSIAVGKTVNVKLNPDLLQKQIDGVFDTDGMLHYSSGLKRIIYVYLYRNEFVVANDSLDLKYTGKTIDTTSKAQIKVSYLSDSNQKKMSAPPLIVNKTSTVYKNLLFIHSPAHGLYESKDMWSQASTVDVYNLNDASYVSSFYIYKIGDDKIRSILAHENYLYALIGNHIVCYKFSNSLLEHYRSEL
ncbi:MauE/DoxX family redox-associated membrane protein [Flavobacterium plurextorum]|uniref:MauE/DoxX family redox-associated membrane protein n=1 Tax=Flavobacterium TaxID=237 RepID=UPI00214D7A86|nr:MULTISPECIES: MauE/DoxX family redox-associated membrane protein [Flavobacterium]UUW11026.1 hypothetical protein NLG42_09460 [Flavobacterium plurextorum]